jgi:CheY-like chemotaxis protein
MATILVVEDEPDLRFMIRTVLELDGHRVIEAASGEESLQHAAEVDVVLLDLKLPGIDGFEVLARLPRGLRTPVVMMSAQPGPAAADAAVERGCYAYLNKPFRLAELRELIPEALRAGSQREGAPTQRAEAP